MDHHPFDTVPTTNLYQAGACGGWVWGCTWGLSCQVQVVVGLGVHMGILGFELSGIGGSLAGHLGILGLELSGAGPVGGGGQETWGFFGSSCREYVVGCGLAGHLAILGRELSGICGVGVRDTRRAVV